MNLVSQTNKLLMEKTIEELLSTDFIKKINGSTMIAFNGVMSQDVIVGLGEVLRSELHHFHPLTIVNRIFAIYVEMTQNILHYSNSKADSNGKEIGLGSVLVFNTPDGYNLVTVNQVNENQKLLLTKKCELINSMNEDELKDHYLQKRRQSAESDSKGAGLGFIDIARRSGQPIVYSFEGVGESNFNFYLSSKILIG